MFDVMDIRKDESELKADVAPMNLMISDFRVFLNNNSINPEMLKGDNFSQLMSYIWDGSSNGVSEDVIEMRETILSSYGQSARENICVRISNLPLPNYIEEYKQERDKPE